MRERYVIRAVYDTGVGLRSYPLGADLSGTPDHDRRPDAFGVYCVNDDGTQTWVQDLRSFVGARRAVRRLRRRAH